MIVEACLLLSWAQVRNAQVEKAPVVIKSSLKKEEADELVRKLEAGMQMALPLNCGSISHSNCCRGACSGLT